MTSAKAPASVRLSRDNYLPGMSVRAQPRGPGKGQTPTVPDASNPTTMPANGVIRGHDLFGRAVVDTEHGERRKLNWGRVSLLPGSSFSPGDNTADARMELLLQGLPSHALQPAPGKLMDALALSLARPVAHGHTVGAVLDAVRNDDRHTNLAVGGAIRDTTHQLFLDPSSDAEMLTGFFADTDAVTTSLPSETRASVTGLTGEPDSFWTHESADRFGVVGVGDRKLGLDIATLRVGQADRSGAVFGKHLGPDSLARDFTVNQIYLLLDEGMTVDPTGHGIEDAKARVLRVNEHEMMQNPLLSLRYIKFRTRGFTGAERTRELMRQHAEAIWPGMVENNRFVNDFLRIVPASCTDKASLETFLGKVEKVMREDGYDALYANVVAPSVPGILTELESREAAKTA